MAEMLRRWEEAVQRWGASPADAEVAGTDILARYAEPHRRYHNAEHIGEVLDALGGLIDLVALPDRAAAVELAAWLHDVVYDPRARPGTNEAASARYASRVLAGLDVAGPVVAETARLVRLTAGHRAPVTDGGAAALVDADLWILAAPPPRYRRYVAAVRCEYSMVDDSGWREGRSALLSGFLERPRIYVTDRASAAWEARARRNMAEELAALGGGHPQP